MGYNRDSAILTPMKIAILGAGLCGLATAWHLLDKNITSDLTLFDPAGIGGGASGVAAGLLHPYAGARAKLNHFAQEGYTATQKLLDVATKSLGEPIVQPTGVLRIALSDQQKSDFAKTAKIYDDVEWWEADRCQATIEGLVEAPGIFIRSGATINTMKYLEGLWIACEAMGARLVQQAADSLDQFDQVIIAAGYASASFADIPLNPVKGQVLELAWPEGLPPLPFGISSRAYLLMNSPNSCLAGATFEHHFDSPAPDIEEAKKHILPKAAAIIPALATAKILDCRAGIRASTPNHLPLIGQVGEGRWVITGMGSKGLLYHALYAEQLVSLICKST